MPHKGVQALRRTAASTIIDIENKINQRIEKICEYSECDKGSRELSGLRAQKTVCGERVHPAAESIVEPYRETVVTMWKDGGNKRSIFPVLQSQGYTGSANAIYQYILKLGKEFPDEIVRVRKPSGAVQKLKGDFDVTQAKNRPQLSLENVARDCVYKAVLKEDFAPNSVEIEDDSSGGSLVDYR